VICKTPGAPEGLAVPAPVISHEWGKDWIMITINETLSWSIVTQTFGSD